VTRLWSIGAADCGGVGFKRGCGAPGAAEKGGDAAIVVARAAGGALDPGAPSQPAIHWSGHLFIQPHNQPIQLPQQLEYGFNGEVSQYQHNHQHAKHDPI